MPVSDEHARRFHELYAAGQTPWDTGRPSPELLRVVEAGLLPGRTMLEMGCGTGTNSLELARRGYAVTAVDLTELAIERARERSRQLGVAVDFRSGDLVRTQLGGPFDCLFDLGLYHGLRRIDLAGFRRVLRSVSRPGTRWLCLAGNAREPLPDGPPTVSEEEFRRELGGLFAFLEVRECRLEIRSGSRPLAWSLLMERR